MKNRKVVVPLPADVWGGLQSVVAKMDPYLKQYGFFQHVLVPRAAKDVYEKLNDFGVHCDCVVDNPSKPKLNHAVSTVPQVTSISAR